MNSTSTTQFCNLVYENEILQIIFVKNQQIIFSCIRTHILLPFRAHVAEEARRERLREAAGSHHEGCLNNVHLLNEPPAVFEDVGQSTVDFGGLPNEVPFD